jgi:DNA polymerase III delta prime subunit
MVSLKVWNWRPHKRIAAIGRDFRNEGRRQKELEQLNRDKNALDAIIKGLDIDKSGVETVAQQAADLKIEIEKVETTFTSKGTYDPNEVVVLEQRIRAFQNSVRRLVAVDREILTLEESILKKTRFSDLSSKKLKRL